MADYCDHCSFFLYWHCVFAIFHTSLSSGRIGSGGKNSGGSLLDNLSQIIPNSEAESTTEIELITSRLIIGKAVDELGLQTSVSEKFLPIFGRGWARMTGRSLRVFLCPGLTFLRVFLILLSH